MLGRGTLTLYIALFAVCVLQSLCGSPECLLVEGSRQCGPVFTMHYELKLFPKFTEHKPVFHKRFDRASTPENFGVHCSKYLLWAWLPLAAPVWGICCVMMHRPESQGWVLIPVSGQSPKGTQQECLRQAECARQGCISGRCWDTEVCTEDLCQSEQLLWYRGCSSEP